MTRNIIVNKIVHKEQKRQEQKQETGNKEYIDEALVHRVKSVSD